MSHVNESAGRFALAALGTLVVATYLILYSFLAVLFLMNTMVQTDHFHLRVRMPSVMILEIVQLWSLVLAVCLREAFLFWGARLPCWFQDISFCITLAAYMIIGPMRQAQLIYVFDASWRKWQHRNFVRLKLLGLLLIAFVVPSLYITIEARVIRGCLYMCGEPGCMWGSRWLVMVGYVPIWWLFSLPLMLKLLTIKVEEKVGLMADFSRMSFYNVPCLVASFALIIAVDLQLLPPEPWYSVASALILCVTGFILYYCHIKPAFTYGYAPHLVDPNNDPSQRGMTFSELLELGRSRRQQRAAHRRRSSVTEVSFTVESLDVLDFLSCKTTQDLFLSECRRHFCEEGARYLIRLRELRQLHGLDEPFPRNVERELFYTFIAEDSLYPLPLSRHLSKLLHSQLAPKHHHHGLHDLRASFSRIMNRVAPLGLMPTLDEEEEASRMGHDDPESPEALVQPPQLDYCANLSDKVGLSLDLAADEMQRLLTEKVLPSFLEQPALKALSSTVMLELKQEWAMTGYLAAPSPAVRLNSTSSMPPPDSDRTANDSQPEGGGGGGQ